MCRNMEKTFAIQDKLPSLPVPPLAQTCEKYLDSGSVNFSHHSRGITKLIDEVNPAINVTKPR